MSVRLRRAKAWPAELDPPRAGKYYYNRGVLFLNGGQNDAAINTLKKAVDLDPTLAEAQYEYGVALASKATTDANGKVIPSPGGSAAEVSGNEAGRLLRPDCQGTDLRSRRRPQRAEGQASGQKK
jgi:tetratricopeptide (TPR) repeat protein